MIVLGVSGGFGHDAAACLAIDGQVVAMAEEERLVREKRAPGRVPSEAIRWCLAHAGIDAAEVDELAVSWDRSLDPTSPDLCTALERVLADPVWCGDPPPPTEVPHHLAHAASAHLCSGHEHEVVLVVDGNGEDVSTTVWEGKRGELRELARWGCSQSLGHFFNAATRHVGLGGSEAAGKLMGLASYAGAVEVPPPVELHDEGYRLPAPDVDHLDARERFAELRTAWAATIERGFGPPASAGEWEGGTVVPARLAAVAGWAQATVERALVHTARTWCQRLGTNRVSLAGGVALNCTANGRLVQSSGIGSVFVQPAASDSGGALGAALLVGGATGGPVPFDPFLGPEAGAGRAIDAARRSGMRCRQVSDPAERAAALLAQGAVIGWVQGRAEVGPRALGHRSMLAVPAPSTVRDRVNDLKGRERWRPLSPAIASDRGEPFPARSPYMLLAFPVPGPWRDRLGATVHVDGSCRPLTVDGSHDLRPLLDSLEQRTGTAAVLNTSLNLAGEPMCADGLAAADTFERSDLDALFVDDVCIRR